MNNDAPVKVGEVHEVEIKSVGGKGDGIARVKGFVLFIQGVKKGDYVKIKVTKVLDKVGFAEVVGKLEKPLREPKYEAISKEELNEPIQEETQYEDTDDFGGDLEN